MADDNELVINLKANLEGLQKGLTEALKQVSNFGEKGSDSVDGIKSSFANLGKQIEQSKFIFAGVFASFSALTVTSLKNFGEQELAVTKLTQALRNQGITSESVVKDLSDYATSLQAVTSFADEQIISSQAQLAAFGLTGNALKESTRLTLDLAAAKGIDLNSAATLVGKAFVGETGMLSRYGIIIEEGLSKTEKFAAASKKMHEMFGGQAQAQRQTTLGQFAGLKNAISDLQEEIGKMLAGSAGQLLNWLIELTNKLTAFLSSISPQVQQAIVFVGGLIAGLSGLLAGIGGILAFKGAFIAFFGTIFSWIGATVAIIGVVIAAIVGIATNFLGVRDALIASWNAIVPVFKAIGDFVMIVLPNSIFSLGGLISGFFTELFSKSHNLSNDLSTVIAFLFDKMIGVVNWIVEKVSMFIPDSWKTAMSNIVSTGRTALDQIREAFGKVGSNFTLMIGGVKTSFQEAMDGMKGLAIQTDSDIKEMEEKHLTLYQQWTNIRLAAGQEEARSRTQTFEKMYESLSLAQESWGDIAKNISSQVFTQFGNGIADMIMKGKRFSDVMKEIWKDLARAIIAEIVKMIAKWLVFLALKAATGGGAGLFFQHGGIISEPTLLIGMRSGARGIAGEAGPEVIQPIGQGGLRPFSPGGTGGLSPAFAGADDSQVNVTVNITGQFIEGNESKWQELIRQRIVPEIRRFTMTSPIGPFTRRRGATA